MTHEMAGEGPDLSRWIGGDYSMLRLEVGTRDLDSKATLQEIGYLEDAAGALFPDADIIVTGSMPEYAALNEYVANGQVRSLAIALAVITVLMMTVFKSVKLGLIGLVPNITPLVIIGGAMGLSKTPLDFLTITIAPMILGLSVDDTIHFFDYIRSEHRRHGDYARATQNAMKVVGRALLMTTIIIAAAFAAYCFSNLNIMVNLGVLIILGIVSALLSDYLVAPILIRWSRPFKSE